MLMTPWQPHTDLWDKMNQFRQDLDGVFESFGIGDGRWTANPAAYPPINLWEDGDHVYAEAELAGTEESDLEIYVVGGNQLTLTYDRKPWMPGEGVWHRQECGFGTFSRTVTLPMDVEADRIEARLHSGVLTITMPKTETARPRKITVKTA
jgi:HSP20 family protein